MILIGFIRNKFSAYSNYEITPQQVVSEPTPLHDLEFSLFTGIIELKFLQFKLYVPCIICFWVKFDFLN